MRVAIVSDSPTLPTGFARTTRSLIKALTSSGHAVSCYGIGIFRQAFDPALYGCRIWIAGDDTDATRIRFLSFVAEEKPDVILINYDLITVLRWMDFLAKAQVNLEVICHLIVDGLPVYPRVLDGLNRSAAVIAVTRCVQAFLAAELSVPVHYQPHFVDSAKFCPLSDAVTAKRALFGDAFVVGTVAQNRGRKQLVQTVHAIRLLRDAGHNPVLLLHTDKICGTRFGGNPLRKVAEYFDVADIVHLTESHKRVDAMAEDGGPAPSRFGPSMRIEDLGGLTVVERLNLCDAAVVASSYGGFEYGIIEAQSCGVPVCVTDDSGIMMEVAGGACEPLRPSFFEFTVYGAHVWKLAPETIATALAKLAADPARRAELRLEGVQNARRYDEAANEASLAETLNSILGSLPARLKSRVA
jgi:glycosyltransferase involved in cell wall biosynthesis